MSPAAPARVTTAEMVTRLRRHYIKPGEPLPGGTFLTEVQLGVRRADALYVGFMQSRGRRLVGHEIKVSRADWLHELDQPEKAEVWASQCHAWYVVAPDQNVVYPAELPAGWGLMVIDPKTKVRLRIVVAAEIHNDRTPSWEATHAIVQKQDTERAQLIAEAKVKAREERAAEVNDLYSKMNAATNAHDPARAAAEQKALDQFAELFGFTVIDRWGTPSIRFDDESELRFEEVRRSLTLLLANESNVAAALDYRTRHLDRAASELAQAAELVTKASEILK